MTSTDYLEQGIAPKVGGVIWSPHKMIFERGYPLVHKILGVKRKRRDGKLHYQVTVKTTAPSKKVIHKSQTLWLDEID
jgi:hypothetical protein